VVTVVARTKFEIFTVPTTGVGRADYSQDVEKSVEPITTSWQSDYDLYDAFTVGIGATVIREYDLTSGYVIIVYDYYLSTPSVSVIDLEVDLLTALGNWFPVAEKSNTQSVDINMAKGFPFGKKWRILATNYGGAPVDCFFSAHGITTLETQYYGTARGIP